MPDIDGQPLKLKGSLFHHCIPGMGLSGGDITSGDGIHFVLYSCFRYRRYEYLRCPFEDENMNIPLDRAGLLVMLNDGTNLYTLF